MATYLDLLALARNADFQNRVQFSMYKSASYLKSLPTATAQEKLWADRVFKHTTAAQLVEVAIRISVDPAIIAFGASAGDIDIQGAVDATRNVLVGLEA